MNRHHELVFVFLILAVSTAYTEVVNFQSCNTEPDVVQNCTIHEVRVEPCGEAREGKPCKLKRGITARISFDYTPDFEGAALQSRAYWASQMVDLPFLGMESDACLATTCPAVSGQRSTYSMELLISKKFPVRTYDLKWRLWNQQDQECCFMFQIKLHR